jgi:hypothetical protein
VPLLVTMTMACEGETGQLMCISVPYFLLDAQTLLILKYLVPGYNAYAYYGAANVGMNGGLMLRSVPGCFARMLMLMSVADVGRA